MVVRRLTALWLACVSSLGLTGLAAQAQERCAAEIEAMQQAYRAAADAAPPTYEDVLPFVDGAFACLGPEATEEHARVSEYEAFLLLEMGRTEQLLLAFERYFRDVAVAAPPNRHARQLTRYGFLLSQLNLHGESLTAYAESAGLADRLAPLEAGRQLSETGEHFRELGRLADAERYFAAADSFLALSELPARFHLATLRLRQARLVLDRLGRSPHADPGRLPVALAFLNEAGDIFETHEDGRRQRPVVTIGRATVLRRLGRHAEAAASLDRAESLLRNLEDRADRWALFYEERVRTALAQGKVAQAETAATAFRVLADTVRTLDYQSRAHTLLGLVAEAEADTRPDALYDAEAFYQRAMRYALESRARYGLVDVSPDAWVEGQRPFRALVRLYLRQGRHAEAFATLDHARARYFRDLRDAARRQQRLTPRDRAALDSLRAVQEDARRALDRTDLSVGERSQFTSSVHRAQLGIDDLTALPDEDVLDEGVEAEPLSIEAMQAALNTQERALVTYFLDDDIGAAFVLTADTLAVASVPTEDLADLLRTTLPSDSDPTLSGDPFDLDMFHRLYGLLLAPFEEVLIDEDALVIIPEGSLVRLPFALLTTAPSTAYATAPYLVHRYALSTALSAASSFEPAPFEAAQTATASLPLLAMGRSTFARPSESEREATRSVAVASSLTSLPLVEAEVRAAHRYLGGRMLLDEAATKAAFFETAPRARVLHLASHALVDPEAPMSSFVVLAPDTTADTDTSGGATSSFLFLSEIRQASLRAELVLLSACSTTRGSAHLSEGMIGLQYAFQAAGGRSVLATAWPVNDAAMAELVTAFYAHLTDGLSKDHALRRAQLDYLARHEGALTHPSFWGGLVLQGDVTPLDLPRRWSWLWLGVAALALLASAFFWHRRTSP